MANEGLKIITCRASQEGEVPPRGQWAVLWRIGLILARNIIFILLYLVAAGGGELRGTFEDGVIDLTEDEPEEEDAFWG